MIIDILIIDREREDFDELIGKEPDYDTTRSLTTALHVKEDAIIAFWKDPIDHDIVINIYGDSFRTHYNEKLYNKLKALINKEEVECKEYKHDPSITGPL